MKKKSNLFWLLPIIILLSVFRLPAALTRPVQNEDEDRRSWDSEFLKKRPKSTSTSGRQVRYKRITKAVGPLRKESVENKELVQGSVIGVTLWRLRQPVKTDKKGNNARILDRVEDQPVEWVAERINPETKLVEGQRVRLTVEVPRPGYLYVIDREQYSDGTFGDPYLVFPIKRARGIENNEVNAGVPLEFPSLEDNYPYFVLRRSRPDHVGEALTLLVAPAPIPDLDIGTKILKLSREQYEQWQRLWSAEFEIYQLVGGEGGLYSNEEKDAATRTRTLTQEDPLPQTLYRVAKGQSEPVMVNFSINFRK